MKRIAIIIMCIAFTAISIIANIVAFDIYHLEHCYVQDCTKCMAICNAINFIRNINYIVKYIGSLSIIASLATIIKKNKTNNGLRTLVNWKVQFNE